MNSFTNPSLKKVTRPLALFVVVLAITVFGLFATTINPVRAAAPTGFTSQVYQDTDDDGIVDTIVLVINGGEALTVCVVDADELATDWTYVANGLTGTSIASASCETGTATITFILTGGSSQITGTTSIPTIAYNNDDADNSIANASGNLGAIGATAIIDDAAPVIVSARFIRNGSQGDYYENCIWLTYSENMSKSTANGDPSTPALGDITTAGTIAGIGSFSTPGDVTVPTTYNQVAGYGTIVIFSMAKNGATIKNIDSTSTTAPSGTLTPIASSALFEAYASNKMVNTNHTVTPTTSVAWDVTKPEITSVTLHDAQNDNDLIDRATIVFSEQMLDNNIVSVDATLGGQAGTFTTGGSNDTTITFNISNDNLTTQEPQFVYSGTTSLITDRAGNILATTTPGTIAEDDIVEALGTPTPTGRYNYAYPPVFVGQIFNPSPGAVNVGFYRPQAFTVGSDGLYYSIASGDQMGQKFNDSGDVLASFGGRGTYEGQFYNPTGIAVNVSGMIYVIDAYNNVQKFDSNGNFLFAIGSDGTGDGQFSYPLAIALDGSGNVFVVDTNGHRIQKFDASGNFLAKWGSYGSGDGELNYPRGIAFDSVGNFYVADYGNNRIQKFDASGNFLAKWGSLGSGDGELNGPSGIAVNSLGESFVVDQVNARIVKFNANGDFMTAWGSEGTANGQFAAFDSTSSISVDAQDRVYVVDTLNNRIQIFDANGQYVSQIGSGGIGSGQFNAVGGLDYDATGNIYAIDVYNHRVQKFDASGNFLLEFGGSGSGDGQMLYPIGLAVNDSGEVFVAEQGNQRVQKFDASGNFLAKWGSLGSGDGQFNNPVQINIDAGGSVYVGDSNNHRIQKFDTNGNFLTKWGGAGSGDGQFLWVDAVAFDSDGNIYTAEFNNCRIQKFDSNLIFIKKWGACGTDNGQFVEPLQITVDQYDLIYVTEALNNRVQVFDTEGNFLGKWGSYGNTAGQFIYPVGIAINDQGRIIVGDANNKIQMFEYDGGPFAPYSWTLTPTLDKSRYYSGETVRFSITTSMEQANPLTSEANQMQVVMDTGVKVPLSYSSTDGNGDTVWTGEYAIPADLESGTHLYIVQANAALVMTDVVVDFDSPATGTSNTGLTAVGSFSFTRHASVPWTPSSDDNSSSSSVSVPILPETSLLADDISDDADDTPTVSVSINDDKGLVSVPNPPCVSGALIKGSPSAVYYCGADGKRYVFVNSRVYFTWYPDFSTVEILSDADIAKIPLGGNVTYCPGVKLVKAQTGPKVYVVCGGGLLRWVTSEAIAEKLYGLDWNKTIDDIPDSFFVNYTHGVSITE